MTGFQNYHFFNGKDNGGQEIHCHGHGWFGCMYIDTILDLSSLCQANHPETDIGQIYQ
jgi:hypothetical protein